MLGSEPLAVGPTVMLGAAPALRPDPGREALTVLRRYAFPSWSPAAATSLPLSSRAGRRVTVVGLVGRSYVQNQLAREAIAAPLT
jgi:hypothetical protein